MSSTALITFVLIAGFVWGGFVFFASLAVRKERAKLGSEEPIEG